MTDPAAGVFLVATPEMSDPRFSRTVILLIAHSADGSMGVILNRRTRVPLEEALPDLSIPDRRMHTLHFGGPVAPSRLLYLYDGESLDGDAQVLDSIHWGTRLKHLQKLVKSHTEDRLRVFFGYAGWGPGQLDFELSLDSWRLEEAETAQIFDADPDGLWRRLTPGDRGVITRAPTHRSPLL